MKTVTFSYQQASRALQLALFALVLGVFSSNINAAETININTADAQALKSIPGIGADRAKQIIALRQQNNGLKSFDELLKVSGIGAKTLVKIKQHASLDSGISTLPKGHKKPKHKNTAEAEAGAEAAN